MFQLQQPETFKATVTVSVVQEHGGWKEESFVGEFKRAPEEDRERLLKLSNVELVRDRLIGWSMKDKDRQDVPFNDANLDALCNITGAVRETTITFWRFNTGAREKN